MTSKVGTEVWKVGKERFKGLLTTMQKENEYGQCIVCYRSHCWSEEVVLHKIVLGSHPWQCLENIYGTIYYRPARLCNDVRQKPYLCAVSAQSCMCTFV